jgi:HAD superfamily hydrolase (TIGR01509 family)
MKKTVIFDVDGTLVDTNWMHAESWAKTFKKFGVAVSKAEVLPLIGTGGEKVTKEFFNPQELEKFAGAAIEYHSKNIARIAKNAKVFPHVKELLQELKNRGKSIVLATSARRVIVEAHIKNMGVRDLIDGVVSSSDVKRTKPDPDIFEKALKKVAVSAEQAVVVGDTVWDVIAAKEANIPTVAVLSGGNTMEDLLKAGAAEVYKDVAALLSHLDESMLR